MFARRELAIEYHLAFPQSPSITMAQMLTTGPWMATPAVGTVSRRYALLVQVPMSMGLQTLVSSSTPPGGRRSVSRPVASTRIQAPRAADERGLPVGEVLAMVDEHRKSGRSGSSGRRPSTSSSLPAAQLPAGGRRARTMTGSRCTVTATAGT